MQLPQPHVQISPEVLQLAVPDAVLRGTGGNGEGEILTHGALSPNLVRTDFQRSAQKRPGQSLNCVCNIPQVGPHHPLQFDIQTLLTRVSPTHPQR
jgi:hypothetical protein